MAPEAENKEEWSSRAAFILAAIGSAVGLGNLWRFPYVAGENGGGVFVLFYLICVLLIGLPVWLQSFLSAGAGGCLPWAAWCALQSLKDGPAGGRCNHGSA